MGGCVLQGPPPRSRRALRAACRSAPFSLRPRRRAFANRDRDSHFGVPARGPGCAHRFNVFRTAPGPSGLRSQDRGDVHSPGVGGRDGRRCSHCWCSERRIRAPRAAKIDGDGGWGALGLRFGGGDSSREGVWGHGGGWGLKTAAPGSAHSHRFRIPVPEAVGGNVRGATQNPEV